jgi:hypothetical protein
MHHAHNSTQSTETVPSDNKTCVHCVNNNKDKKYHLHFDKKMKAGCVVVIPFASLTIDSQVESKEQKEQDISFILGQTVLMGLNSIDADLNRLDDITNPFEFDK